jgi:hypothetical protein
MTVHTYGSIDFNQPNTGSPFPTLNGDLSVLARLAAAFAPHETAPPTLAVMLDAGALLVAGALVEVKAQASAAITPPTANPRIDRVTISPNTGLLTITAGTEAANPVPPAIPAGQLPVAQLRLDVGMTAITNRQIRDERIAPTAGGGGLLGVQTFTSSGTYTPTPGTTSVVVELVGGGGAGGGCAAPSGSQGSAGGGGSSAAYARARFTSGFGGVAVTVGAGGAATSSGSSRGNAGSASSFGALTSAPGGLGGYVGYATTPGVVVGGAEASSASTGGTLMNTAGNPGAPGLVLGTGMVIGGNGGSSPYGGSGTGTGNGAGMAATAPGAGGGGASSIASGTARNSGAGANGIVIVYEYSA